MPYELTCPSCHARLLLKDETGEQYLLCPRCLNMVPHPTAATQGQPAAAPGTAVSAQPRQSARAVPSVESEAKRAIWGGYFIILALTLLITGGMMLAFRSAINAPGDAGMYVLWILVALVVVLTVLILFPIGRGLRRGLSAPAVVILLVVLAPVAFAIVFFVVCTATVVVSVAGK